MRAVQTPGSILKHQMARCGQYLTSPAPVTDNASKQGMRTIQIEFIQCAHNIIDLESRLDLLV